MEEEEDDPRASLRRELQKRRPAMFRVRKVCRTGLGREIPADLRGDVWQVLLGVESKDRFLVDDNIRDTAQDLENQRVIRVDAQRTRPDVPHFRQPEIETLVCKILTYYVKTKDIRYKQGLNEVLAPFIMLRKEPSLPDGTIFNLFYAFIDRFLPHLYVHEEFHALQCSFRLFRLLLLYHDPELCNHLDKHNLSPELYATPWFLTMFARNVPVKVLFRLWDVYLLEEDDGGALLNVFVALALVTQNRSGFLECDPSDLPIFVTGILGSSNDGNSCSSSRGSGTLEVDSKPDADEVVNGEKASPPVAHKMMSLVESVDKVIACAEHLREETPLSFGDCYTRAVLHRQCPNARLVELLEAQPCIAISAKQAISLINKQREKSMLIRVVDCRCRESFEENHLVGSMHLDPIWLDDPGLLTQALDALVTRCMAPAPDVIIQVIFIGERPGPGCVSDHDSDSGPSSTHVDRVSHRFIVQALLKGIKRVSFLEGGWESLQSVSGTEPLLEQGMSIEQLIESPQPKSRTTTLDTIKDAMNIDSLKGAAIGLMGRERRPSNTSTTAMAHANDEEVPSSSSPMWIRRIGKSIGEGIFSASPSEGEPRSMQTTHVEESPSNAASIMSSLVSKLKVGGPDHDIGHAAKQQSVSSPPTPPKSPDEGWVDLRLWGNCKGTNSPRDELHLFNVSEDERPGSALIAISPGYVIFLRPHPDRTNFARIEEKWPMEDLLKITSKKSVDNLVVFHFKKPGQGGSSQGSYIVTESRKCIELVKRYYTSR